jgi:hypothetical protein
MPNHKNSDKKAIGRPRNVDPHIVLGNAKVFRAQFSHAWPTLGKQILAAKSPVEVWDVVKSGRGIISNMHDFRFSERIFEVIRDPKFPQARSKSQIHFLADSLGADGLVTPRRSREICAIERAKVRHVIVRRDFYIECTCGYAGPAFDGACQKCGTAELSEELMRREDYE